MHFRDAAACRAAIRAGGIELDLSDKVITDQDAEWIASALADPAVCVFRQYSFDDASQCVTQASL